MSDIEQLKKERNQAYLELLRLTSMRRGLEETHSEIKAQEDEALRVWRDADYALALIDGRFEKVKPGVRKKAKEVNEDDLTEEQINNILAAYNQGPEPVEEEDG